ncbi:MAG: D-glycero-beta-D-manno-heptose-7-phosphate kinase [Ignavibacteriota bacterium]|jgi:rfaE bifunctional protein kinase chain/domain|nr:D-glycero-beta-D-manno-heptose-7-phosphate kinase [Ignavibacteriota bacterium]MBW7841776.1 D-glycero-beta-D-manno-heptose-7-phosphate kinase [Ignavibacterium sp.]MCO6446623.1 D-glycero-beta-D-manno-heptose-7-phosphate kinase [Ignavibacterium album]MCZ2269154.1 D-glycero-beta-D-manno-heptose-7-phosphate kinase [Ignavibacteriales bacterium]MDX9711248.1 D-glycero-beta-D-manno-heptose-7-phosphate kinase [Ignavibacteriaceae bacterium]
MNKISSKRLLQLKNRFKGKRIAIVGDMMLDIYFWGDVKRISPEAPVPVLEVESEFYRFGGAANCALNINTLGGIAEPIGVIGYDNYGTIFNSLLNDQKINRNGIIEDDSRPTTTKTRVIADSQHIVRIDKENKEVLNKTIQNKIFDYMKNLIKSLDGIILQDYNKGVLSASMITQLIKLANKNNVIITVDPKFNNFFEYKNVTVIKPNRKEAEDILGMKIKTDIDISVAGNTLLKKLNAKNVLLTLGEGGIAVFERDKPEMRMPTKARKVADVSGAGDTVISTLTIALAAGADIYEASFLANYAGGLVCEEVGIVPIEIDKLFNTIIRENK